jgi:transcriptional regulator with XRE-family HTH domain
MRRAIREAAGVSAARVAREIGVTRQAVTFWERGLRRPTGRFLVAYLEVLDMLREAIQNEP